jgi:hypothetical protein
MALAVKPGDQISASIILNTFGQWTVSLANITTGQNFQTVVPYNSSESSAEWVVEMPTQVGAGFIPIDNFGTAQFYGTTAIKGGQELNLEQLGAQPMTMLNSSQQILAAPSGINNYGAGFSVARSAVTVAPSSGFSGFGRGGFRRQGRGAQGFNFVSVSQKGFGRQRGFFNLSGFSRLSNSGLRFYILK